MNRLVRAVKSRRGDAFPLTIAITLILLMLFCGISEYFRLLSIAQNVRDVMQGVVLVAVNDNYDDVYHGVREGYSGAYRPMGGSFEESLDYGSIYAQLDNRLGLQVSGEQHLRLTQGGQTEYQLSELSVSIRNAPFASGDSAAARFMLDSAIMLEVPISFCGQLLPPMRMTARASAGYTPKF